MGSIIFIDVGISALDKQTIVNTRANKLRAISAKSVEVRRNSVSLGLTKHCHKRACSVKFVGIVHERRYFKQEAPTAPSFKDVDCTIADYNRTCRDGRCNDRTCLMRVKRESHKRKQP